MQRLTTYKIFPFLLFAILFAFGYLPFFIWSPLVALGQDSYGYFYYTRLIQHHELPLPSLLSIDLPLGLPLFFLLVKQVSASVQTIVLAQVLLYLLTSFFLIHKVQKYLPGHAALVAFLLALFAIDSVTIRLNTVLYTESIYMSALFVVVGLLLDAVYRPSFRTYFVVSLAILLPAFIRSNGIFLYFLPVFFGWYAWFKLRNATFVKGLVAGTLTGLLLWSGSNYIFKGAFMFGDYKRIENVFNRTKEEAQKNYAEDIKNIEGYDPAETFVHRHSRLFGEYLLNFSVTKPSFYYSYIQTRYKDFVVDRVQNSPDLLITNYYLLDSLDPGLRTYMFTGLLDRSERIRNIEKAFDPSHISDNKWGFATHVVYKLTSLAIRNKVVVLLWLLALVFSGWHVLFAATVNRFKLLLFALAIIHFLSIVVVAVGHSRTQIRYAHVTEFLLLVSAGIFLWQYLPSFTLAKRPS